MSNNHPNRRKRPDPIRQDLRGALLRVLLSYDGVDGLGPQNKGQCEIIADDLARAGMARLRRRGDLFVHDSRWPTSVIPPKPL